MSELESVELETVIIERVRMGIFGLHLIKKTPRWLSVLRVVYKETYVMIGSGKFDIYVVGIEESLFVLVDYY